MAPPSPPASLPDVELLLREAIERHLGGWAPFQEENPEAVVPRKLGDSIRYSLFSPGKRIRPRIVLACASMIGLAPKAAIPAALALEMIHCFTLIHDDLPCMDNSDTRRGRPSNHKRFGEATALLAGDGLIPLAFEVFLGARDYVPHPQLARALGRLCWACGPRGVVGGQSAEFALGEDSRIDDLRTMHLQKTGALFIASFLIPRDLAGVPEESPQGLAIDALAREVGLAFQVADDLEDAVEDAARALAEKGEKSEKPADKRKTARASKEKIEADPRSILHYLSWKEARSMSLQRLAMATQGLESAWGAPAQSLIAICDELKRKLEGLGDSPND